MNAPFAYPERVPVNAALRLQTNLISLLSAIDAVLQTKDAPDKEIARWRRAAEQLQKEQAALQAEVEAFQRDDREPLLRHAAELRLLARRMDGYAASFATAAEAKAILDLRQLLVLTAWQIAAAASGSEAAGL